MKNKDATAKQMTQELFNVFLQLRDDILLL